MYNQKFYEDLRKTSLTSAKEIVPLILQYVHPKSVVDVGCGIGYFLKIFGEHGVHDILGIDGADVQKEWLLVLEKQFRQIDLKKEFFLPRTFDLALCLEVAEHLPEESSENLVASLCCLSPIVIFSAAIPCQGGAHHINEQWPEYWVEKFKKRGYAVVDCFRDRIWHNKNVSFWYAQNLLLFIRENELSNFPLLKEHYSATRGQTLARVHPAGFLKRQLRVCVRALKNLLK